MKPINGWTKETIIAHIMFNFNGKSINEFNRCLYRGPNETKCAVGMFIPDEKYDPIVDTMGFYKNGICARNFINKYELNDVMPLDAFSMYLLQQVHDQSNPEDTLDDMINWIEKNVEDV